MRKKITIITVILIVIAASLIAYYQYQKARENRPLKEKFDELCVKWSEERFRLYKKSPMGTGRFAYVNKYLNEIICLGPRVTPYIIELIKDRPIPGLGMALHCITGKNFTGDPETENGVDYKLLSKLFVKWWYKDRHHAYRLFDTRYREWKEFTEEDTKEKRFKFCAVRDLGIEIIPLLIKKLEHGDKEVLPMLYDLTCHIIKKDDSYETAREKWYTMRQDKVFVDKKIREIENTQDPAILANKWIGIIESSNPIYLQNAEIGLEKLPETNVIQNILLDALKNNNTESVRKSVALALGRRKYANPEFKKKVKQALIESLKDPNGQVRKEAAYALGCLGAIESIPILREVYTDEKYRESWNIYKDRVCITKEASPVNYKIERTFSKFVKLKHSTFNDKK